MVFKSGFVVMAPDGDPERHRATIKTSAFALTTVIVELMNFDQAVTVCKDLAQNEGIQALILCPGFSHEAVAMIVDSVGDGVAVSVARGDVQSTLLTGTILTRDGWFPEGH